MTGNEVTKRPCVFFDDARGDLGPLTDLRASFEIRTGALTTQERLTRALSLDTIAVYAPTGIAEVVSCRWNGPVNALPEMDNEVPILVVNGRCVLPLDVLAELEPGQAAVEGASGDLVGACLFATDIVRLMAGEDPTTEKITIHDQVLLAKPWDVIVHRNRAIDIDLHLLAHGSGLVSEETVCIMGDGGVCIEPDASIAPGVVFDASSGPIYIGRRAIIRPGAVILGPTSVGEASVITEQAILRAHTAIGPVCKVGGEVSGVIFQGYANKAHAGYLGDSFVGEWVNLGAGTTGSNLLNTYANISAVAQPGGGRERTGLQFFGCVLGDHTKTAISSRIMTGSVAHTGVMWAATAAMTGCVEPFAWVTDGGCRLTRLGKFEEVAATVMRRREVALDGAYLNRIRMLHKRAAT